MKLIFTLTLSSLTYALAQERRGGVKVVKEFTHAFGIQVADILPGDNDTVDKFMTGFISAYADRLKKTDKATQRIVRSYVEEMAADKDYGQKESGRNLNCHDANCDVPLSLRGVWGYGCWCNFGNQLLKGKGNPVNAHDSACERMQECLRCARMDGVDDGYDCDPRNAVYSAAFFPATSTNSLGSGCSVQNPGNPCGTHVCTCEMQFINDILDLVWQSYKYDPSFTHPDNPMGGTFDDEANCGTTFPGDGEIECCGAYPFRYPYNALQEDCCTVDYQPFNPFDYVCCSNGVQAISNGGCNKKKK